MKRRDSLRTLVALGAAVAPWSPAAQQTGKVRRLGFLSLNPASPRTTGAFLKGMQELGYVEGRHFVVEWRFADGKAERLPALAAEIVQSNVDIIVAAPSGAVRAAQKASVDTPIVMAASSDPVGWGFVRSLARPGGNVTGLSTLGGDTGTKLPDLLLSMVPNVSHIAVIDNADTVSRTMSKSVQAGIGQAGRKALVIEASTPQQFEGAFATMAREKVDALIVATSSFSPRQRRQIAELALKHRLPSAFASREHVEAGGLMSYGTNFGELYRRSATYVDKIFKGAKPGDLAVEQPASFELVVNLKTAAALGLRIPDAVLLRATEVIR